MSGEERDHTSSEEDEDDDDIEQYDGHSQPEEVLPTSSTSHLQDASWNQEYPDDEGNPPQPDTDSSQPQDAPPAGLEEEDTKE